MIHPIIYALDISQRIFGCEEEWHLSVLALHDFLNLIVIV